MRALVLAVVMFAACGRVDFDARTGDATPLRVGVTSGPAAPAAGTVTVTRPADVASGDLLLLAVYANQLATITAPPTWSRVFDQPDAFALFHASYHEWRAAANEPMTYDLDVTSSLVAWALVAYRDVPDVPDVDAATFIDGVPSTSSVTYTTPGVPTTAVDELVVMMIDDSGSEGTDGWADASGATKIADAQRVAVYVTAAGPGDVVFDAVVNVPSAIDPHGAVRVIGWNR